MVDQTNEAPKPAETKPAAAVENKPVDAMATAPEGKPAPAEDAVATTPEPAPAAKPAEVPAPMAETKAPEAPAPAEKKVEPAADVKATEPAPKVQETQKAETPAPAETKTEAPAPKAEETKPAAAAETPVPEEPAAPAAGILQTPIKDAGTVNIVKAPEYSTFEEKVAHLFEHGSSIERTIIQKIHDYRMAVAPRKPVDANEGARQQQGLWFAIRDLINRVDDPVEFEKGWTLLLEHVQYYKHDIFSMQYIHRFWRNLTMPKAAQEAFKSIVNVMTLTANPEKRTEGLAQVDLDRSLTPEFTEAGRSRLMAFYKLL